MQVHSLAGRELEGCTYLTPLEGEEAGLLPGEHVTATAGTGLVGTLSTVYSYLSSRIMLEAAMSLATEILLAN